MLIEDMSLLLLLLLLVVSRLLVILIIILLLLLPIIPLLSMAFRFTFLIKRQSFQLLAGQRCNVCHVAMSPADYEQPANHSPCDHQLANRGSRQRRVYSVSHFDCSGSVDSLGFSHTPPCSTMCMNPILSPFPPSTVRQFHTPPPSQTGLRLATFGHVEQFKGRLASGKGQ